MRRLIVVGDVHGCYEELKLLLDKLSMAKSDVLVSVGDLICKGPLSDRVLDLVLSLENFKAVIGNHELRFLNEWRAGRKSKIKPYDEETVRQMGDRLETYMRQISKWPFYLDFPECLVVHAGLRPGVVLEKQSMEDLTELRTIEPEDKPWYEYYKGSKPVMFGHWVRREPLVRKNAVGLDTGCVYGGKLTAYVFPDKRCVSVQAKKIYRERKKAWD